MHNIILSQYFWTWSFPFEIVYHIPAWNIKMVRLTLLRKFEATYVSSQLYQDQFNEIIR